MLCCRRADGWPGHRQGPSTKATAGHQATWAHEKQLEEEGQAPPQRFTSGLRAVSSDSELVTGKLARRAPPCRRPPQSGTVCSAESSIFLAPLSVSTAHGPSSNTECTFSRATAVGRRFPDPPHALSPSGQSLLTGLKADASCCGTAPPLPQPGCLCSRSPQTQGLSSTSGC